jgi:hypothetical protein
MQRNMTGTYITPSLKEILKKKKYIFCIIYNKQSNSPELKLPENFSECELR